MPRILVVEGFTDATFFQELLGRIYLSDVSRESAYQPGRENIPTGLRGVLPDGTLLEVGFITAGGRDRIPIAMRQLLDTRVFEFAVAQDLDDGTPDQVVQTVRQVVYSHVGMAFSVPSTPSRRIEIEDGAITVIPMGLHQDDTLATLGTTSHALEDYLIKLLLEDTGLRQKAPELQQLLLEILPTIRRYDGSPNSSKEIFQLIKPLVQHGFSDTGVVNKLFEDANSDTLQRVMAPLLPDLELALVPQ